MASANLRGAVLALSSDTDRAVRVLKSLGTAERNLFFATLRDLNVSRWAVTLARLASDPAYSDDFPPGDLVRARHIARALIGEVAA